MGSSTKWSGPWNQIEWGSSHFVWTNPWWLSCVTSRSCRQSFCGDIMWVPLTIIRSSNWEIFLKIGVRISRVIFRLIWTLLFYWNRSISQEVNNLKKLYFYLKEHVSSSRKFVYTFFFMSAKYHRLSRSSVVLQVLIILWNSLISQFMKM